MDEIQQRQNSGIDSIQMNPLPNDSRRRSSRGFLHPDHARIMARRSSLSPNLEPAAEESTGFDTSCSSSVASSTASITANLPDSLQEQRRSSAHYSLFDALDLEYALMRAAARGSIGPYSLSQSLQKLTFTQSLAFPALARGLADKQNKSEKHPRINKIESGPNAFAKVATVLVLVLISVLVFGVVYKFVRT